MAGEEVELFDLASKRDKNVCWSLNPWKVRLILNYKKIPYHTTWLEYPELAPTLKALDIPPNASGAAYTSPTVRFPDGTAIMDTKKIAAEVEKRHPEPSLYLDAPELPEVEALWAKINDALAGVTRPAIPRDILNPASVPHFEETRAKQFGMSLEELGRQRGGDDAYNAAEHGLKELDSLYKKHGGPFVLGEKPSFSDFIIIGGLVFFQRVVSQSALDKLIARAPALGTLYEASQSLIAKDD